MNKAAAERDLYGLLPGLTGELPSELLQLTTSLLAQSRSKASSLKPDEEIARSYVCANIACERLKQKLDLPDIKPRPPCPQRTYKKVYPYLSSTLTPTSSTSTRRAGKHTPTSTPTTPRTPARPLRDTPSKPTPGKSSLRQRLSDSRTQSAARPAHISAATTDDDFPRWVMTAGRALCGAFGVPVVASHVFAGVSSVARSLAESGSAATPSRKRARQSLLEEEGFDEQLLPALIFVITSYVAAQFEDQLSGEEYLKRRDMGFAVVVKHSPFSDLDKEEFIITVEKYLREGRENGWFEMPWFENVEDAARRESEMEADEAEAELEAGEDEGDRVGVRRKRKATNDFEDDSVASARRGGGEMRMYSVDWLSEERTREYGRWKATILAEVD